LVALDATAMAQVEGGVPRERYVDQPARSLDAVPRPRPRPDPPAPAPAAGAPALSRPMRVGLRLLTVLMIGLGLFSLLATIGTGTDPQLRGDPANWAALLCFWLAAAAFGLPGVLWRRRWRRAARRAATGS